jgi:hypothetical protein
VKRFAEGREVVIVRPTAKLEHVGREHASVLAHLEHALERLERKALGNYSVPDQLRRLDDEGVRDRLAEGNLDDAADLDSGKERRGDLVGEETVEWPRDGY